MEFVQNEKTGLIVSPEATSLAHAFDQIYADRERAKRWGESGRDLYRSMNITWNGVVEKLLG